MQQRWEKEGLPNRCTPPKAGLIVQTASTSPAAILFVYQRYKRPDKKCESTRKLSLGLIVVFTSISTLQSGGVSILFWAESSSAAAAAGSSLIKSIRL
jgi:hypothetical protein